MPSFYERRYDITRVKEFSVRTRQGDRAVVSKRLSRATIGLKEAAIHRKAYEAGIPTVKIYGEIFDKGNAYPLMEKFSGINLDAFVHWINERNNRANALFEAVINDWKEHGEPVDLGPYGFLADSGSVKRLFAEFLECSERRDALSVLSDLHGKRVHPSLHGPIDLTSIPRPRYLTRLLNEYWRVDSIEAFARLDARQMKVRMQNARASVIRPLRQVQGKLVGACYKAIFGSPAVSVSGLEQEAQRLNALCVERGIIHTDLYARNILVEWDFSRNEPVYAPDGSLTFKLIDWEPVKQVI